MHAGRLWDGIGETLRENVDAQPMPSPAPVAAAEPDDLVAALAAHVAQDDAWWHDPHWVAEMRTSCCTPIA